MGIMSFNEGTGAAERRPAGPFFYITKLRAVSCIAVVILHTALAAGSFEMTDTQRMWTMLLRNLMLWSVPCFIMVTGALLLSPARGMDYRKLFGRYIARMVLCILLFTAVFELFDVILTGEEPGLWILGEYAFKVIAGRSWSHMWYLYMLVGLYLLLPFYRMIAARAEKRDLLYLLGVYFVFLSVLPMLREVFDSDIAFFVCVSGIYPFFLFAGHLIHSGTAKIRRGMLWILLLISTGLLAAATAAAYLAPSELLQSLLGTYAFPPTVIQSVCVFGLFSEYGGGERGIRVWRSIDRCSFGVYLIHMLFLKLLYVGFGFDPYAHGGTALLIPVAAGVFAVSFLASAVMKRIPGLNRLI